MIFYGVKFLTYSDNGAGVVNNFLVAIASEDAITFWNLLDSRGKGYFLGMWFFALGNADLGAISLLAEDENFLKDALNQIIKDLKTSLVAILDGPRVGDLQYTDSHHAVVPVSATSEEEKVVTDHIPLVLELAPTQGQYDGKVGMTCWKIDTLKCFSVRKN
ncbi:hypothetical protein SAMN05660649_01170 [Desulfotomaculum arcticum]|uniref:Uncharacterized protein n=1 Tax=Desulfotruncus arcticus DSM 17038 TaxID=1121424 RepID=A0A1I2QDP9_9FIRM|nr:hypothetical protein SAMN05660649_01170 [Desulfotomaculum arcticum] [Desulfotruncus arcticus DSM 17038]